MSDAVKEMRRLIDQLNEASRTYYQEAREIMSNYDYDALYDKLVQLEKDRHRDVRQPDGACRL